MLTDEKRDFPLAYHITINCYGCWLHGEPGSVDRHCNRNDSDHPPTNDSLFGFERESLTQPPYTLDAARRKAVMAAIKEVCVYRGWILFAAHVRSRHIHAVVQADARPEKVMSDFKAYASRRLNRDGFESKCRKRWARHGSTKYKWTWQEVQNTMNYVLRKQGEPMEVYER